MGRHRLLTAILTGLAAAPAFAQRQNSDAPPVDPQTELAGFTVAEGLEVSLYAAEPMLLKPIGINFDAQGRLWVAGSPTYPQVAPGQTPGDKIFVLEDSDHDGKADKSTVFAEGLLIATSVEMAEDGGVYACNSTELLHLRDTDGDGKADQKRVVLSGFGTEDTHHVIHQLRWDYGGRLNFLQGIYVGSRVETPRGTINGLASTLWQMRPASLDLRIYCQGLVNPWGVTWNRYGQMFLTDGAGGEGVNFAPPAAHFMAAYNGQRVLKGLNPGSPKYCGAEIISSRHFPDDWQGDLITHDFRANRTVRYKLSPDGAGFSAKLMPDVITSTDRAYRPVDVKMGPDGALYIADWYNPIINHGEVDFRDPRRDKVHGRIWRVTAKGRPLVEPPNIAKANVEQLLAMLESPEQWTRLQARLRLRTIAPASEVAEALGKRVAARSTVTPEVEQTMLESLWTYETIDVPNPALATRLLKAQTPQIRAAAARVVGHWSAAMADAAKLLGPLAADAEPVVRLEAIGALATVGLQRQDPSVVPLAMHAIDKPMDPFIEHVLARTLGDLKDSWLPLATADQLKFTKPEHLTYAFKSVQSGEALKKIAADLKAKKIPMEQRPEAYDLIASVGGSAELSLVLDDAVNAEIAAPIRSAAIKALTEAARQRKATPDGPVPARVRKLLKDKSEPMQAAGVRFAGIFRAADLRPTLQEMLTGPETPPSVRPVVAQSLAMFGPELTSTLAAAAEESQPVQVRSAAVAGLAMLDVQAAAKQAALLLVNAETLDPTVVLAALLQREGGVQALATELKGKKLPADTAKLALRYVQGVGVDIGDLGEVIRTSAGATAGGPVDLNPEQMRQTIADVMSKGDAARGETVYRSAALGCAQCHMIGGAGGALAPDLRAIGASSPLDYIVDSLLHPAKAVKDGFAATSVITTDGDLLQGIKVREDDSELVLRDNLRDEFSVGLSTIKKRTEGGSLMPAGLTESLTRQEFLDLVRFLAELGKPGPFAVGSEPIIRRWRVLDPVPPELLKAGANPPASDDETGWFPVYSRVDGGLPTTDLPGESPVAFVRFQLNVEAAGRATIVLDDANGVTAWLAGSLASRTIDGKELSLDLPAGVATVTLRVDRSARGDTPLRASIKEGGSARITPVMGR